MRDARALLPEKHELLHSRLAELLVLFPCRSEIALEMDDALLGGVRLIALVLHMDADALPERLAVRIVVALAVFRRDTEGLPRRRESEASVVALIEQMLRAVARLVTTRWCLRERSCTSSVPPHSCHRFFPDHSWVLVPPLADEHRPVLARGGVDVPELRGVETFGALFPHHAHSSQNGPTSLVQTFIGTTVNIGLAPWIGDRSLAAEPAPSTS